LVGYLSVRYQTCVRLYLNINKHSFTAEKWVQNKLISLLMVFFSFYDSDIVKAYRYRIFIGPALHGRF